MRKQGLSLKLDCKTPSPALHAFSFYLTTPSLVTGHMSIPAETQNLMRLLSQVILADGHIHASEIEALVSGVRELALKDDTGNLLSASQIRQWFHDYGQELDEIWAEMPKDVALTHLILSLADWPEKDAVVKVLENISLSDAEFHIKEKTLISIVRAYWQFEGLDAPGAKIDI